MTLYPDNNLGNKQGGVSVPYGLQFTFGANDITTDVKSLLVVFPQEFSIPLSTIACANYYGFLTDSIGCSVEANNQISIDMTSLIIGDGAAWLTITSILNPVVESGSFLLTIIAVSARLISAKQP